MRRKGIKGWERRNGKERVVKERMGKEKENL